MVLSLKYRMYLFHLKRHMTPLQHDQYLKRMRTRGQASLSDTTFATLERMHWQWQDPSQEESKEEKDTESEDEALPSKKSKTVADDDAEVHQVLQDLVRCVTLESTTV